MMLRLALALAGDSASDASTSDLGPSSSGNDKGEVDDRESSLVWVMLSYQTIILIKDVAYYNAPMRYLCQ